MKKEIIKLVEEFEEVYGDYLVRFTEAAAKGTEVPPDMPTVTICDWLTRTLTNIAEESVREEREKVRVVLEGLLDTEATGVALVLLREKFDWASETGLAVAKRTYEAVARNKVIREAIALLSPSEPIKQTNV